MLDRCLLSVHICSFCDVTMILVLLAFFRATAAGETRYIFHLILMSKVRLENKFCEKSGALPRTHKKSEHEHLSRMEEIFSDLRVKNP